MKREVRFKCGHDYTTWVFGDENEVELQVAAMGKKCECPDCAFNRFGGIPPMPHSTAMEQAGEMALPHLRGTIHQINLAMMIRAQMLSLSDDAIWHMFKLESYILGSLPKYEKLCAEIFRKRNPAIYSHAFMINSFRNEAKAQLEASWWLAHRNRYANGLTNASIRRIYKWERYLEHQAEHETFD